MHFPAPMPTPLPLPCLTSATSVASKSASSLILSDFGQAAFTHPPAHVIFLSVLPEWRNWQTQQTQNLPPLSGVWVRLPPPAHASNETLGNPRKQRFCWDFDDSGKLQLCQALPSDDTF